MSADLLSATDENGTDLSVDMNAPGTCFVTLFSTDEFGPTHTAFVMRANEDGTAKAARLIEALKTWIDHVTGSGLKRG